MFKELNNLKIFFEEPEREFHLREIARLTKKNPVTVKKHLEIAVKNKILLRKKERGLELYSTNSENKAYKNSKKIYNELKLKQSGLLQFLEEEFNFPTIILFGSYQRAEDNVNSDIDIFILTEIKKRLNLTKFEKNLNRKIQLHIMNQKQFNQNKKNNPELINTIINGNVLLGFLEIC